MTKNVYSFWSLNLMGVKQFYFFIYSVMKQPTESASKLVVVPAVEAAVESHASVRGHGQEWQPVNNLNHNKLS